MTTDLIHAPWTAAQVTALNAFQHYGRMHPFTCGAEHASGQSPVLVATNGGWVCPDPQCVYRQDWAHAFMAEPAAPAGVGVSATPSRTDLVERAAAAIWALYADAEPSRHGLVLANPHAVADAVLAVLPPPAEAHRLALSEALGLGTGAPWDAIYDRATELGLPPLDRDPVAQRLGLLPPPADRAAVLRGAASFVEAMNEGCGQRKPCASCDAREDVADELRRLADEAQQQPAEVRPTAYELPPAPPAEDWPEPELADEVDDEPAVDARQDEAEGGRG
ncbi:hypothetical protein [Streptomyces sp. NPDC046859]|uniref:hypothetical protein n=1 Tax=Streptomyces sp. NPDC046859 TaxID=3155734 RepID=UPI0033F5340A